MFSHLQGWHIVILVIMALLLFGAPKLPGLARSVGQSLRIFKSEVRQMQDENKPAATDEEPVEGRIVNNPTPPSTPGTPGTDHRPAGNPPTSL